jgi:hypothetical protein
MGIIGSIPTKQPATFRAFGIMSGTVNGWNWFGHAGEGLR